MPPHIYQALANTVLIVHVGLVLFVIGGLLVTLVGGARHWGWVRNFWFRAAHLGAIATVVAEAWFGMVCPLTAFELWLRARAGQLVYEGDFIAYWLSRFLFFEAPPWVFIAVYSAFAALVAVSWRLVPPLLPGRWKGA